MKKLFFIYIFIITTFIVNGQDVEYEVVYNSGTGEYEAYAHILNANIPSVIGTPSAFSIVVPTDPSTSEPAAPNIPDSFTSVNPPTGAGWVLTNDDNDPTLNLPPVKDESTNTDILRYVMTTGNYTAGSLNAGQSVLLFRFSYNEGCVGNVRVWDNDLDPTSSQLPSGVNYDNTFNLLATNYYSGNRNNDGTTCSYTKNGDGDWNDPNNWLETEVPSANDDATILAGVTTTIFANENYAIRNLTIQEGTALDPTLFTIENNATLSIGRNLTKSDDFEGEGYVVFNGRTLLNGFEPINGGTTGPQQIIGNGTTAGSFSNIRLRNDFGLLLTDDAEITGVLDIDDGDFTIENDGTDINFLTFKSDDQNNTAVVDEVASGSSIDGCVVVERYIPAKRAFRLLSSPVTTDSPGCSEKVTISENLQEGEQVTDFTQYGSANPILGFGTHITGSTTGANGLDATETGNPSMFLYNNGTGPNDGGFTAVTNTIDTEESTLFAGQDFLLMVRGDRDLDLNDPVVANSQTGNPTTLRFTGELATGNQVFAAGPGQEQLNGTQNVFNIIANPYQAQIDIHDVLNDVSTTGVQVDQVWVYDPTTAGAFGSYVLIEFDGSGNATTTPAAIVGDPNPVNEFLQPNQSMFVQNLDVESPNPSITIKEEHKTNSTNTTTVFSAPSNQELSVQLNLYTSDNDLRDGVIVRMGDNFDDAITEEDAIKFPNYLENLSTNNNGTLLTSDRRVLDNANENVQLHLTNYTESGYVFKINVNNPDNKPIYLVDNYLGTQTLLDATYIEHNFTADQSVPASIAADRFELQFNNSTLSNDSFETSASGIQVYPNPVENVVSISKGQFNGEWESLYIYDIAGKLVISLDNLDQSSELNVDMSNLSQGIYILKVDTSNGQFQEKLLKK